MRPWSSGSSRWDIPLYPYPTYPISGMSSGISLSTTCSSPIRNTKIQKSWDRKRSWKRFVEFCCEGMGSLGVTQCGKCLLPRPSEHALTPVAMGLDLRFQVFDPFCRWTKLQNMTFFLKKVSEFELWFCGFVKKKTIFLIKYTVLYISSSLKKPQFCRCRRYALDVHRQGSSEALLTNLIVTSGGGETAGGWGRFRLFKYTNFVCFV